MKTLYEFVTFSALLSALTTNSMLIASDLHAQSLLSTIEANAEAIASFDLIIESKTYSDADASSIEIVERVMIDRKSAVAVYLKRGKRVTTDIENGTKDQTKVLYESWLFKDGETNQRAFPDPMTRVPDANTLDSFLQKSKCFNPKLVGNTFFSECYRWGDAASLQSSRFRSLARLKDSRSVDPTVQIEIAAKHAATVFEWEFSGVELMPRMLSTFIKSENRTVRNCNEVIRWGDVNGIAVPVSVETDGLVGYRSADGSEQSKPVQHDHSFFWLALNKNVRSESIGSTQIASLQEVIKMTDVDAIRKQVITGSNSK